MPTPTLTIKQMVRLYLRITWELSNDEDNELDLLIERGKAAINGYAGKTCDFAKDLLAQQLLLDWCRYANSHQPEYFSDNFVSEILALRLTAEAEAEEASW